MDSVFEIESFKEAISANFSGNLCIGSAAMAINPKHQSQLAIFSLDRSFAVFKLNHSTISLSQKTKAQKKPFKNWSDCFNTINFSPNGLLVSLTFWDETLVSLYSSRPILKKIRVWNRKKSANYIYKAIWISNSEFLCSFYHPGILELFNVASSVPKMRLDPRPTRRNGWIMALALCSFGSEVVCAGRDNINGRHVVFKMRLVDQNTRVEWIHQNHKTQIYDLKISNCGSYAFSCGNDAQVVVASVKTGDIVAQHQCMENFIVGLMISPKDEVILVQSYDGIALVRLGNESLEVKGQQLEVEQSITKEQINGRDVSALTFNWSSIDKKTLGLFIGMGDGAVYRAALRLMI